MIIDHSIWEELSRIDEQAKFEDSNRKAHNKKHKKDPRAHDLKMDLSEVEYGEEASKLSELPAYPITSPRSPGKVFGYFTQAGTKVKFRFLGTSRDVETVVYTGDDIEGEINTYYSLRFTELMFKATPYKSKPYNSSKDNRYKSDLDGKFEGLNLFKNKAYNVDNLSKEEISEIDMKIKNGESI